MQTIEAHYNSNPYHNSQHAADVTQNVGVLLASDGLSDQLSQLEVLACILAACVHDVRHPGLVPPPSPPTTPFHSSHLHPEVTLAHTACAVLLRWDQTLKHIEPAGNRQQVANKL